jgi:hypothetical protein
VNSAIRRRRIGVAAVLATAAVAVAGTTAAASPTNSNNTGSSTTKAGLYQDYLTGASVQAAGEDQCSKPVAQRTGAWFCPQTDKPAAKATPAETGFCNFSGCYTEYDNRHIDFQSDTDYWGYGSWTAGTVSFKTEWSLDGGTAITAKPVILTTSIPVTNVHFTGDLFNPPPGKVGTEIPGKYYASSAGNSSGTISWPFPDAGYTAWDSDNYNRTCVIEASWALPDYPGYWYVYVKSPIASNGNGRNTPPFGAFYFRGADQLPATPFVGNYRR